MLFRNSIASGSASYHYPDSWVSSTNTYLLAILLCPNCLHLRPFIRPYQSNMCLNPNSLYIALFYLCSTPEPKYVCFLHESVSFSLFTN